jgi:thiopeptide-type bacteriocin biosynthesis protein
MDITHDLFCADSRAILAYLRAPRGTGRREASLLAISAMLTAAGLDTFERGDVMGKVASLRPPAPASGDPNMTSLTAQLRTLLATPPVPALAQLSAEPWGLAFYTAGHRLAQAAGTGTLTRGLRAVLAHNVIFHWNRLGLSAKTQGILASAARDAWIPAD